MVEHRGLSAAPDSVPCPRRAVQAPPWIGVWRWTSLASWAETLGGGPRGNSVDSGDDLRPGALLPVSLRTPQNPSAGAQTGGCAVPG